MAKKVVATLKTGTGKAHTKCIKMVKSEKNGSLLFQNGSRAQRTDQRFFR